MSAVKTDALAWWRNHGSEATFAQAWDATTQRHRQAVLRSLVGVPFVSLLELGCGVGTNLRLIQETYPAIARLAGVDANENALAYASERLSGVALAKGTFLEGLAGTDPYEIILTSYALAYVPPEEIGGVMELILHKPGVQMVIIAEPQGGWFGPIGQMQDDRQFPEWRHDYARLIRVRRPMAVMVQRPVWPPENWCDGVLTAYFMEGA